MYICGGAWLSVVVLAGHGGDGRLCVAVEVLLMYMFMWRLWFIMNKVQLDHVCHQNTMQQRWTLENMQGAKKKQEV